jgi:hypothetical protein
VIVHSVGAVGSVTLATYVLKGKLVTVKNVTTEMV